MHTPDAKTTLCAIIGDPVAHSMSPAMHNAAYEELGLNYAYLAFKVKPDELSEAIAGIRALGVRGVSVTVPHKAAVMQSLDEIDSTAQAIGAVNTIVNTNGQLKGYNTDWEGAMRSIEEVTSITDKNVIILGAGGAARGIAYGLAQRKAGHLTILNRTVEKAKLLAKELDVDFGSLDELEHTLPDADILFQTTSVGMHPHEDQTLVPRQLLRQDLFVTDAVYNPFETQLIRDARQAGCQVALGYRMLLWQGVTQFELYAKQQAPVEVMEEALLQHLTS